VCVCVSVCVCVCYIFTNVENMLLDSVCKLLLILSVNRTT